MLQTSIALHRADLIPTGTDTGLKLLFARNLEEVREAQRLRFQIFNQEYGAHIGNAETGLDTDRFDLYCEHLLVFDEDREEVVGTYRMLMPEGAKRLGGYYSEQEFDLAGPMRAGGRVMELGRSCVHPDYRNGGTISLLWHGIAAAMERHNIDFLMGCASVHEERGDRIGALYQRLGGYLADPEHRVTPRLPLPLFDPSAQCEPAPIPPLLKGYLRAGAKIGGEPAWDPEFGSADFFIWLGAGWISSRYRKHYCQTTLS